MLALVDAPTPHPHHVHVSLGCAAQVTGIVVTCQPGDETVRRNPVCPLGEYGATIHDKLKRLPGAVAVPVQNDRTQSNTPRPTADPGAIGCEHLEINCVQ